MPDARRSFEDYLDQDFYLDDLHTVRLPESTRRVIASMAASLFASPPPSELAQPSPGKILCPACHGRSIPGDGTWMCTTCNGECEIDEPDPGHHQETLIADAQRRAHASPSAPPDAATAREGLAQKLTAKIADWRKRADEAERRGRLAFPEGHAAEANAINLFCDELESLLHCPSVKGT